MAGNRAAQRLVRDMLQQDRVVVQRDRATAPTVTPSAGVIQRDAAAAAAQVQGARGDAEAEQAQIRKDAAAQAAELQQQGRQGSAPLQAQSAAQGAALQGQSTTQGARLEQQSASQGAALQGQASARGSQLAGASAAHSGALQQDAGSISARLQSDATALEATATATHDAAQTALVQDSMGMQADADAGAKGSQEQMGTLDAQTRGRVEGMTTRTQALVDQKNALLTEYQGPGAHDPERFRQRWTALQRQIDPLEQEQASLDRVQPSGDSIGERAGTLWAGLTQRGQALLNRVSSIASGAWNAVQGRWTSLQGTAAAALAALQGRISTGVSGLKAMAEGAWTGLQDAANRAWTSLQGLAGSAWTSLQAAAAGAWSALQSQATAAWTALKDVADSAVAGLSTKITGLVNRISSAIGRIVDAITDAVGSVLSRLRSATAGALEFLRTRAGAAWAAVKDVGTRAWEGVKRAGTRAWQGLKDLGTHAWEGLKNVGSRAWQGLKDVGTRAWTGLRDLGQRAWNGLKTGWATLKSKAESAWSWLRRGWDALRRKAGQAWDAIKRRARQALDWVKGKWAAMKAWLGRALAWLKSKWQWLKSKLKINIRLPDIQLFGAIPIAGRSLFSKSTGKLPIGGIDVETQAGPIALDAYVRGDVAAGFLGGAIGPGVLRNVSITLDPLEKKAAGAGELAVSANTGVGITAEGVLGGSAYWSGVGGSLEGGMRVNGTVQGSAALVSKGALLYEDGEFTLRYSTELAPCLSGTLLLDAVGRVKVGVETPDDGGDFDEGPACALPGKDAGPPAGTALPAPRGGPASPAGFAPVPGPGPGPGGSTPALPVGPDAPKARAPQGKRHEITLWEGAWALGEWTLEKCWKLGLAVDVGGSGYQGGGGSGGGGGASSGFALVGKAANGSVAVKPAPLPLAPMVSGMFGSAKLRGQLVDTPPTAALGAKPTPGAGPAPKPGRMRAQVQQGRLHFGSAVATSSDAKKGVTAYEFELAQSMAIENWRARHADPRNRKPGEPAPPPVSALLGGVHKAKSAQSQEIRTRIVPSGGIPASRTGDINELRQCTDGVDLLSKRDCDRDELNPIRLDVENLDGHNLRCTR